MIKENFNPLEISDDEISNEMDRASRGASLVENTNKIQLEKKERTPVKGNNKLITDLPECLEADFLKVKSLGITKESWMKYIRIAITEKIDNDLNAVEEKKIELIQSLSSI